MSGVNPLALSPAPHTPPVFRVLRQAWRDYMAQGGGLSWVVNNVANQSHTAALTVTGTVQGDKSVLKPIMVVVALNQNGQNVTKQTVPANVSTGAFTATFPANALAAGTAFAALTTTMVVAPQNSNTFTLS